MEAQAGRVEVSSLAPKSAGKVQGHYSFTGGALTFDVMREAVLCREPEGIMNVEEVIVRVLEGDAVSVGFDGPDLMRWTAADIVLTLARIPTD